jgi:hypothetical protein
MGKKLFRPLANAWHHNDDNATHAQYPASMPAQTPVAANSKPLARYSMAFISDDFFWKSSENRPGRR